VFYFVCVLFFCFVMLFFFIDFCFMGLFFQFFQFRVYKRSKLCVPHRPSHVLDNTLRPYTRVCVPPSLARFCVVFSKSGLPEPTVVSVEGSLPF